MRVKVNGINISYNVDGKGDAIILLHGNGGSKKIFAELTKLLSNKYKVYSIDSRCHGLSDDSKIITYELMRDDVIEFIKKLNIKNPILYGFSDGGIIGLMIAIKEQNLLKKLIISGPNLTPKGFKKSMLIYCKLGYFFTKNKLFKLMYKEPNISISELEKITVSTIIIAGSHDIVKKKHLDVICENIKDCKLEIIKNANHSNYVSNNKKLYNILLKYL